MIGITREALPVVMNAGGLEFRFTPVGNMILSFYHACPCRYRRRDR